MGFSLVRYQPLLARDENKKYLPVLALIGNKIYKVQEWNELFKIVLFSCCYKTGNMSRLMEDVNVSVQNYEKNVLISDRVEESPYFTKFTPELYIRVFDSDYRNFRLLHRIINYIKGSDCRIFLAIYDEERDLSCLDEKTDILIDSLNGKKVVSSKYIVAHINGKVLSDKEKFYRRIEREFDKKVLIGDIDIGDDEPLLKEYMVSAIRKVAFDDSPIEHEKVFSYGLVRAALKHYASKKFWPNLKDEYGISVPGNYQNRINLRFKEIMQKYGKLYDEDTTNYVQNICMHAFVCDRCADQFFDYMFDFFRLDLSRNIENSIDDDGNDVFDILIEEIGSSVQDIMVHTTMALKMNPVGCKNRFRRLLRMIDDSYWNETDYSSSSNRMTVLFNKWKNDPKSSFAKELKSETSSRKKGRGEKLLSRPTVIYSPESTQFSIYLPKQILKHCTAEEHPEWNISFANSERSIEPSLLQGKAFMFTDECRIDLDSSRLFEDIDIVLRSERTSYYRRRIRSSDIRLFNSKNRNFDIPADFIPDDISYMFVKKDKKPDMINGTFSYIDRSENCYDIFHLDPKNGDILIMPDGHALSIGRPLIEGLIGNTAEKGVFAYRNGERYQVVSSPEKIFFRTTKERFRGSQLRIISNDEKKSFRVSEGQYVEFRIDEGLDEIYGYLIDLRDYVTKDGVHRVDIDIPGLSVRSYNICLIRGFGYEYVGAPYFFKDYGTISFPSYLKPVESEDWETKNGRKILQFPLDESMKDGNDYVKDRKLIIPFSTGPEILELVFDLPVLFWKYTPEGAWQIEKPEETTIKALPQNIYISGDIDLTGAFMFISDADDPRGTEVHINYDRDADLYYFRTVDIRSHLNRDRQFRHAAISLGGKQETFFRIACKSIVRSNSITGDFMNGRIYGYFDIYGSSDYMVTVRRGDTIIEEDIPVTDGRFEIECDVEEGQYTVVLYELEDDDSGFGAISYELANYRLNIVDPRNFSGCDLEIVSIKDRNNLLAKLRLSADYEIHDIMRVDYSENYDDGDVYTWLYDSSDRSLMKSFVYYTGTLGVISYTGHFVNICKCLVIFDNVRDLNEVLINVDTDGYLNGLEYSPERGYLQPDMNRMSKLEKRHVKMIDDDLYSIRIKIKE